MSGGKGREHVTSNFPQRAGGWLHTPSRQHPHRHALQFFDHGQGHAAGAQHFVDALVVPAGDFAGGEAVAAFDVQDKDDLLQQQLHGLGPLGCCGDGGLLGCLCGGRQRFA